MGGLSIESGVLFQYRPDAEQTIRVVHNANQMYVATDGQLDESLLLGKLQAMANNDQIRSRLFDAMLNGQPAAYFAIDIANTSSSSSHYKFQYDPFDGAMHMRVFDRDTHKRLVKLDTLSDIYGMTLGLGDFVDATDSMNSRLIDHKLFMGTDGAFHQFTIDRILLHELSHNVLGTHDLKWLDPLQPIGYQTTHQNTQGEAVAFANEMLDNLGDQVDRVSYLGTIAINEQDHAEVSGLKMGVSYSEDKPIDYYFSGAGYGGADGGLRSNLDFGNNYHLYAAYERHNSVIDARIQGDLNGIILGRHNFEERIIGGDGDDYIYADQFTDPTRPEYITNGAPDEIDGGGGDDHIFAGGSDDHIIGGKGNDLIYGGGGDDLVDYSQLRFREGVFGGIFDIEYRGPAHGIKAIIGTKDEAGRDAQHVTDDGTGGEDWLYEIEQINGTTHSDTFRIDQIPDHPLKITGINWTGTKPDVWDTADFSRLSHGISMSDGRSIDGTELEFSQVARLIGTNYSDVITLTNRPAHGPKDLETQTFYAADLGAGDDRVTVKGENIYVFLGAGNDIVWNQGQDIKINLGSGANQVSLGKDVFVMGADGDDRVMIDQTHAAHGAVRIHGLQEAPWTVGNYGVSYGLDDSGTLQIRSLTGGITGIANWTPASGNQNAVAGVHVFELDWTAFRLLDADQVTGSVTDFGGVLDHLWKALWGKERTPGADPLVLDLDGDGIELSGVSALAPKFDLDGDGFAELTGWVLEQDGFLVRDLNGDQAITELAEFFGSPTQDGFSALSALDGNHDGWVDASDARFASLQIWRDLDQDGVTDAGELASLSDYDITRIAVTADNTTPEQNAGNVVTATGEFVRGDGSTGTVGNVDFALDNYLTEQVSKIALTPEAAGLPDLRGYGTLPDLHAAMSLDDGFRQRVQEGLTDLDKVDLAELRTAARPILHDWAQSTASLLPEDQRPPLTDGLVVRVKPGDDGTPQVIDLAYYDSASGSWALASGQTVYDAAGQDVPAPTLGDILAMPADRPGSALFTTPSHASWQQIDGADINFLERYSGEALPIHDNPTYDSSAIAGAQELFDLINQRMDVMAVRLAMQGPLAKYFDGIDYNIETDNFGPTSDNDRQLVPMYEKILADSPADAAGAQDWLGAWAPIIDVVTDDYSRGASYLQNTYSFIFSNVVAAYENLRDAGTLTDPLTVQASAEALGIPAGIIVDNASDVLTGTGENDIFYLGEGNETALGGLGHDSYVVGRNFGQDVITDIEPAGRVQTPDQVRFAHLRAEDVTAWRDGLDLVIKVNGSTDSLTITDQFLGEKPALIGGNLHADAGVGEIIFADGVVWDQIGIAQAVSHPLASDDRLIGTGKIDVLDGGAGNDYLSGGSESDLYIFDRGYGHDIIEDLEDNILIPAVDYVLFAEDINPEDVSFSRIGSTDDLRITINDTGDILDVTGQFWASYTGPFGTQWFDRIERFEFANGFGLTASDIMEQLVQDAKTDGDDVIYGFSHEDVLDGGAGNDFLSGGNENDVYIFGRGYDHDIIDEQRTDVASGGFDIVQFNPGVSADDLVFSRGANLNDLVITIAGTTDVLEIRQEFTSHVLFSGAQYIEEFQFADGDVLTLNDVRLRLIDQSITAGDDLVRGFDTDDVITGGAGTDRLEGSDGSDTYLFTIGDGHDVIHDEVTNLARSNNDQIRFGTGIALDDLTFSRDGDNLVIALPGGADSLTIENQFASRSIWQIEQFSFADGTQLSAADVFDRTMAIMGTAGNDTLSGTSQADILMGLDGDDRLSGGRAADKLIGGTGDDYLDGGHGGDQYVYTIGDGHDEIRDGGYAARYETDSLVFGPGILPSDILISRGVRADHAVIEFASLPGSITLDYQFWSKAGSWGIDRFVFADGTQWNQNEFRQQFLAMSTTDGDDVIRGFADDDTLSGGAGNDRLEGSWGSDTYLYNRGDGHDVIYDYGYNAPYNTDVLQFGADIALTDLTAWRSRTDANDLLLKLNDGSGSVTLEDFNRGSGYTIDEVVFADGQRLDRAQLKTLFDQALLENIVPEAQADSFSTEAGRPLALRAQDLLGNDSDGDGDALSLVAVDGAENGTVSFDPLTGEVSFTPDADFTGTARFSYLIDDGHGGQASGLAEIDVTAPVTTINTVTGTAAADSLTGSTGRDHISAGAGDDRLFGLQGDDLLIGGDGADYFDGGQGSDTVSYADSDGWVSVNLKWGRGYGNDAQGDRFERGTIENLEGSEYRDRLTGDDGDNILSGRDGNDALAGGAGDDQLIGGAGNDLFYTNSGADYHDGGAGKDTVTYYNSRGAVSVDLTTGSGSGGYAEGDTFALGTIETLTGSRYNDQLTGDDLANSINGLWGDDIIDARGGDDRIDGGRGDDTFIVTRGTGHDVIISFQAGAGTDDQIDLSDFDFNNLDEVLAVSHQQGNQTVIELEPDSSLTLTSTYLSDLHNDDFLF